MGFRGDWGEITAQICLWEQSVTKILEQDKEVKGNSIVAENFDIHFCLNFHYYNAFMSVRETWHYALFPPNFGIFKFL